MQILMKFFKSHGAFINKTIHYHKFECKKLRLLEGQRQKGKY